MSKIITVLIKSSEMSRVFKSNYSREDIQSFTSYILHPYKQLKYFSFCDYINVGDPILGCSDQAEFLLEFQKLQDKQYMVIQDLYKSDTIDSTKRNTQAELLKILSGRFNSNTFFYNSINDSTFIDKNTSEAITSNPELYILSKVNINL